MTAKERMIQSLTDMLEDGETLIHPIYGVLVQGENQYYGYFGFTDKFLLIAFGIGNKYYKYNSCSVRYQFRKR